VSNFGLTEIIVIALILILLFGGKKIPEFIRGVGEAIREFKKSSGDDSNEE
jgi:sec-independent protein translocase protein TatA